MAGLIAWEMARSLWILGYAKNSKYIWVMQRSEGEGQDSGCSRAQIAGNGCEENEVADGSRRH